MSIKIDSLSYLHYDCSRGRCYHPCKARALHVMVEFLFHYALYWTLISFYYRKGKGRVLLSQRSWRRKGLIFVWLVNLRISFSDLFFIVIVVAFWFVFRFALWFFPFRFPLLSVLLLLWFVFSFFYFRSTHGGFFSKDLV